MMKSETRFPPPILQVVAVMAAAGGSGGDGGDCCPFAFSCVGLFLIPAIRGWVIATTGNVVVFNFPFERIGFDLGGFPSCSSDFSRIVETKNMKICSLHDEIVVIVLLSTKATSKTGCREDIEFKPHS